MSLMHDLLKWLREFVGQPKYRYLTGLAIAVLIVCGFFLAVRFPVVLEQAHVRRDGASERIRAIQEYLTEIDRLKARAVTPPLAGSSFQQTIAISLANKLPSLSATLVDASHVRVQGYGSFDTFIVWLGEMQANHRLEAKGLSLVRKDEGVMVDLTLSSVDK